MHTISRFYGKILTEICRYRLTVRTHDSQSCNRGSIPRSGTNTKI